MSKPSWTEQLDLILTSRTTGLNDYRLAIVGIGNELSGDDAAGVVLVQRLNEALSHRSDLLFIDGGLAPENFSGLIRKFSPHQLLFIDAANLDGQPGEIDVFEMEELDGLSFSTHTLPPAILAEYLAAECSCTVKLLGIQPVTFGMEEPMSEAVIKSINTVVDYICKSLK